MFDDNPISVVKMGVEHVDMFDTGFINGSHVYIGRGSPLGNNYTHKDSRYKDVVKVESRECAIEKFEFDLYNRRLSEHSYLALNKVLELSRKSPVTLVCFCKPEKCHGDVIRTYLENSR